MDNDTIGTLVMVIGLIFIMFSMGITLKPQDFYDLLKYPKAVAIGSLCQLLLVPVIGFCCAFVFDLSPLYAVGLIIAATCPGGVSSNLAVYFAKGDVALSVTLSALSTIVTLITIPLWVEFALATYLQSDESVDLSILDTIIKVGAFTILPVTIGMFFRAKKQAWSKSMEPKFAKVGMLILILFVVSGLVRYGQEMGDNITTLVPAVIALNVFSMIVGYISCMAIGVSKRQRAAITIEMGLKNAAVGIIVAAVIVGVPEMALPTYIYIAIMGLSALIFVLFSAYQANTTRSNEGMQG